MSSVCVDAELEVLSTAGQRPGVVAPLPPFQPPSPVRGYQVDDGMDENEPIPATVDDQVFHDDAARLHQFWHEQGVDDDV